MSKVQELNHEFTQGNGSTLLIHCALVLYTTLRIIQNLPFVFQTFLLQAETLCCLSTLMVTFNAWWSKGLCATTFHMLILNKKFPWTTNIALGITVRRSSQGVCEHCLLHVVFRMEMHSRYNLEIPKELFSVVLWNSEILLVAAATYLNIHSNCKQKDWVKLWSSPIQ